MVEVTDACVISKSGERKDCPSVPTRTDHRVRPQFDGCRSRTTGHIHLFNDLESFRYEKATR